MTDAFRLRFISTVLWCQLHTDVRDPKNSLRTPELRPGNWLGEDYLWGEGAPVTVEALAKKRSELLRRKGSVEVREEQVSGRLLLANPTESDICGLSGPQSQGYIDEVDIPPWDTWVHFSHEEPTTPDPEAVRKTRKIYRAQWKRSWDPPRAVSYLLCWVPTPFIPHVNEGIAVNPVDCLFWASEYKERHYNTALLRQLDAQGLLG